MKKFNHVDEIWEALEKCKTAEEVYDIIDYIPQKFGTWWADIVGENQLEVTNQWWDKNQEDMIVESQTFEVIVADDDEDEIKYEVPEYVRNIVKNIHSRGKVD